MNYKIGVPGLTNPSSWETPEDFFESHRPVKSFRVHAMCKRCDGGELHFTGNMWPTGTLGYHHQCDKCGNTIAFSGRKYPAIRYEIIDGDKP